MKVFPPFRLDIANQCLWRRGDAGSEERILLSPKAFAVLAYLVEHAGKLVTHDDLLEAVWPGRVVEPQAVKKQVLAVRSALGDRPKKPLFIETLTTRGYRFIAPVTESTAPSAVFPRGTPYGILVGRAAALEELHESWRRAVSGVRQIVFITGEPGIGKTALAEEFSRQVALDVQPIRIAHGQCIEGYGSKEAYGPVLDALGRLCRGPRGESVVQILASEAPAWLAQLPGLLTREDRERLQQEILGATRQRMLRELGEALDLITTETALLLLLEDLHWVDDSTVDLVSTVARRRTPAKLMLVATCRPLDSEPPGRPLKILMPDLLVHRLCRKIDLPPLNATELEEYLALQSPASSPPLGLSALVHRHSEGNPLFMVAALEHMAKRSLLLHANGRWELQVPLEQIEFEVPDDLRHMIETQLERLSAREQSALELASIAGQSFSTSVIGSAAEIDSASLEDLYEDLSRRHHIVRWIGTAPLPGGSSSEQYEFVHALYRQILYDRQLPNRRARLHRQIGEHLQTLYAPQMEEVVPELAYHFEQAADWPRAIEYLQRAAQIAGRRHAPLQADSMLARSLELARHLPEAQRARTEPQVLAALAAHRMAAFDMRAIDTLETLTACAAAYGLIDVQARALLDLSFFWAFTDAERCLEAAQRALRLSVEQDPVTRTRTRTGCSFRRLTAIGWTAQDAIDYRTGFAALGSEHGVTELAEDCIIQWLSAEYREARRVALEVRAKLLESGANSNLRIEYETSTFVRGVNLLFLGEWGEALEEFATALADARKNDNQDYSLLLRNGEAWLHLHALDYNGVLEISESVLPWLSNPALRATQRLPVRLSAQFRILLILSGSASVGLGNHARALEDFSSAAAEMDRQANFLDWYRRMPLAAGMTELWLAKGDRTRARLEGERFLDLSLASAERTYQGLAWEVNARVALLNQDLARARDCIAKAVSTVEGFEVPLATWQVHATAADIEKQSGNRQAARSHRDVSRVTILRLANSLPEQEPLRKAFLSAPAVGRVLEGGS